MVGRVPAEEQVVELAGSPTALLAGGQGPSMVLLHGPGEPSLWWMRVVPDLVAEHRVIVPDLADRGLVAAGLRDLAGRKGAQRGSCGSRPASDLGAGGGYNPSIFAMVSRWISLVPSGMRIIRAQRNTFSSPVSRMIPLPPRVWTAASATSNRVSVQ